jgi:phosphatidylserine/phosphatidylglycerophosphate/cardiolipin synthase-like enzyme
MATTRVASYASPTLVFLAYDVDDMTDLLGFAIRRTPGHNNTASSYLPNMLTFKGPVTPPAPSNTAPIQKFWWWDSQIDDSDRGKTFTYTVIPITGSADEAQAGTLHQQEGEAASVSVTLPHNVDHSIGTWFNRAVVSSQAFSQKFGQFIRNGNLAGGNLTSALTWLGNGMEQAVPKFIADTTGSLSGAIYHLTDEQFIIPALDQFPGSAELVYDSHVDSRTNVCPNDQAIRDLPKVRFFPRRATAIMHDKFIVRCAGDNAIDVTQGSANYTTEALSVQANVIHAWASPPLAALYLERAQLIQDDPSKAQTARSSGWSKPIKIDEATVSVFFSPEPKGQRNSVDAIVEAVKNATSSVIFCIFDPTDQGLRDAIFDRANDGLMMYGLVNHIPAGGGKQVASTALWDRMDKHADVYDYGYFSKAVHPNGFWWEYASLDGKGPGPLSVYIHHKFVLIDAETDQPTIFTGSQNISNNSIQNNDENLLEITGCQRLARIYLAEFMRLYDHYKARVVFEQSNIGSKAMSATKTAKSRDVTVQSTTHADPHLNLQLATTNAWTKKWTTKGLPESKARIALSSGGLPTVTPEAVSPDEAVSSHADDVNFDGSTAKLKRRKPRTGEE